MADPVNKINKTTARTQAGLEKAIDLLVDANAVPTALTKTELDRLVGITNNIMSLLALKVDIGGSVFATIRVGTSQLIGETQVGELIIYDFNYPGDVNAFSLIRTPTGSQASGSILAETDFVLDNRLGQTITGQNVDIPQPGASPGDATITSTGDTIEADWNRKITVDYDGAVAIGIAALAVDTVGKVHNIVDIGGHCTTGKEITITPVSGLISGQATYVMNTPYESVTIWSNGTDWFVE